MRHALVAAPAAILVSLASGDAVAFPGEFFLDHNTDGDVSTFETLVVGPESAPIDIVVWLDVGQTLVGGVISVSTDSPPSTSRATGARWIAPRRFGRRRLSQGCRRHR